MGFGLISIRAREACLLEMGILKLASCKDPYQRLSRIHEKVQALIRQYQPYTFAIEAPFFGKNVQSMLKLGRAQGVAIAAAMQAGIPVTEYPPKKVKQSITGNGNASKEQVWLMLQRILRFEEKPAYLDATDALAVAICHHYQQQRPVPVSAASKGWAGFIARHPEKILR
jgi:crossover junction endodeoxyribonuclease RuvC